MNQSNDSSGKSNLVSPTFVTIVMAIALGLGNIGIFKLANETHIRDQQPEVLAISPPKKNGDIAAVNTIKTGLHINHFEQFDMVKGDFLFTGIVWFELSSGAFDIAKLSKFTIEKGEILSKSEPITERTQNSLLVRYNIRARFRSTLNYDLFPFDDHRVFIIFSHKHLPNEIFLHSSDKLFIIKPDSSLLGWQQLGKKVVNGYTRSQIDPADETKTIYNPSIIFSIDYKRYSMRYMLAILFTLRIIFFIALYSFCLEMAGAIRLSVGSITGILAYRYVIDRLSPSVGYFIYSDWMFYVFLGGVFFSFLFNLAAGFNPHRMTVRVKKAFIIILHIVTGAAFYFTPWTFW